MNSKSLRRTVAAAALLLVPALATPVLAHHSTASFDYGRDLSLTGTVKAFKWTSPHMFIDVLVNDRAGNQRLWSIECGVPNMNVRNGWKKTDIKAGDKVSMTIHPMRDASVAGGTLMSVKLPDGRILYGPGGDIVPVGGAPARR